MLDQIYFVMEQAKNLMTVRQQWRIWPGPVSGNGEPDWIFQPDTDIVRVCDFGKSTIGILTRDGHLFIGEIDKEGKY